MREIISLIKKHEKIIRYAIAGGLTTLFNLGIFTFAVRTAGIDVTISNILSVVMSIIFAYAINKIFVFKSKTQNMHEMLSEACKFIGSRFLTMVIEVGGVYLIVNILGKNEILGKILTQIIVFILNYVISSSLVFRRK